MTDLPASVVNGLFQHDKCWIQIAVIVFKCALDGKTSTTLCSETKLRIVQLCFVVISMAYG